PGPYSSPPLPPPVAKMARQPRSTHRPRLSTPHERPCSQGEPLICCCMVTCALGSTWPHYLRPPSVDSHLIDAPGPQKIGGATVIDPEAAIVHAPTAILDAFGAADLALEADLAGIRGTAVLA